MATATVPTGDELNKGVGAAIASSIGSVERVKQAMEILRTIKASDFQIETKILFNPLYTATALQRANQEVHVTGTDEVVRKNLYFMAEKIQNIHPLLIQLVQRGFLNLTERENVMKQQDQFLKAVQMLIVIVRKDPSRYKLLLDIFRETGNEDIVDILSNAPLVENIMPPTPTTQGNNNVKPKRETQSPEEKVWFCPHCTYRNRGGIICEMCAKTNDLLAPLSPTTANNTRIACKSCTFLNEAGSQSCAVCGDFLN